MWRFLVEYFHLSKRERNGIAILFMLIILVIAFDFAIPFLFSPKISTDFSRFEMALTELSIQKQKAQEIKERWNLKEFDPNVVSVEELIEMKLPPKIAKSIISYREKVRLFQSPEELLKVYAIDSASFDKLYPFIFIDTALINSENQESGSFAQRAQKQKEFKAENKISLSISGVIFINKLSENDLVQMGIPEKKANAIISFRDRMGGFADDESFGKCYAVDEELYQQMLPFLSFEKPQKALPIISLNSCVLADLLVYPGMNEFRASRILDYRDKLGGFNSFEQIAEIKGLPVERIPEWKPYFEIDQELIKPISINYISFKELLKHPYFDYETTKEIIKLRDKKGKLKSVEELKSIIFVGDSWIKQARPYIKFDP